MKDLVYLSATVVQSPGSAIISLLGLGAVITDGQIRGEKDNEQQIDELYQWRMATIFS
jgi:hypothetical protein